MVEVETKYPKCYIPLKSTTNSGGRGELSKALAASLKGAIKGRLARQGLCAVGESVSSISAAGGGNKSEDGGGRWASTGGGGGRNRSALEESDGIHVIGPHRANC